MKMQAQVVVMLIVAIVIAVSLSLFGADYVATKRAAAVGVQRGGTLEAASLAIYDGTQAEADRTRITQGLDLGSITFRYQLDEAQRNEPETAERADRTVPVSVRNAYRDRRRARERLGCVGSECPQ